MTTPGQTATAASREAEIARLVAAAREQGEPDTYEGKRGWVRYTIGMDLEVTTDPDDPSACWPVVTHNISAGGMGFWSKRKLPAESQCQVREYRSDQSAVWVPAWVRHCTIGIRGHLIGVAFTDPLSTSEEADVEARSAPAGGKRWPWSPRARLAFNRFGVGRWVSSARARRHWRAASAWLSRSSV